MNDDNRYWWTLLDTPRRRSPRTVNKQYEVRIQGQETGPQSQEKGLSSQKR